MAIAVVEKATLIVPKPGQERVLRLLQAFQRLEIINSSGTDEGVFDGPNRQSEEWKSALARIEKAQTVLSEFVRVNAFQKLKNGRPIMTLTVLEETTVSSGWDAICADALSLHDRLDFLRARRAELLRLMDQWTPWQNLFFCPKSEAKHFTFTAVLAGTLKTARLTSFAEGYADATLSKGHWKELFQKEDTVGIILFFPKDMGRAVHDLCKQHEFIPYNFPFNGLPTDLLGSWRSEGEDILREEKDILDKLKDLSAKKDALDLAEEFFSNLLLRNDARKLVMESNSTFFLSGWIEQENKEALNDLLEREMNLPYYIFFSPVEEQEMPEAPVILKNNQFIGAFETLTEMYSMPAYDEVDPTPIMTPFYLVFFGMMVADVGYGLVLLLATLVAKLFLRPDKPLRKSIDFFFYLSFPVIAWGLIYGSIFGASLPFALLTPSSDIIPILILSLIFGWMQLMTGLGISIYVSIKKKDVLGAFSGGISWMALLLGVALLVVSKLVLISNGLFIAGIVLSFLAVLGIVLLPIAENKGHRVKGLMKGIYALYGATGYVGDLVSYTRLMALGIAGGSIAVAFNTITGSLPLIARVTLGIVLTLILHGLNLFLSLLGAYVHGIRLQYVEFFGKFYSGGGRKFSPFKTAEKHIYLAEDDNIQIQKTEESL